jgi:hypothetical protein
MKPAAFTPPAGGFKANASPPGSPPVGGTQPVGGPYGTATGQADAVVWHPSMTYLLLLLAGEIALCWLLVGLTYRRA